MKKDQDGKIREYVLKKKQQRERATQLRQLRRNKEYLTEKEESNQYQKRSRNTNAARIISEAFAPILNEESSNYCHQMKSQFKPPSVHQYNHQPKYTTTNNSDILAMMNEFRTQIHTLQSQIKELNFEIKDLKQNQQHNHHQNQHKHQQHQQYNNHRTKHHHKNVKLQSIQQHKHSLQTRSRTVSAASSSSRSSEQYEYKSDPHINTNMNRGLAHLKKRRIGSSVTKLKRINHGNTTNRNIKQTQWNNKLECNNGVLSHSSSAMGFVNKLSEMDNVVEEVQRVACHQCGRKFIPSALKRHINICKNVFCKKRKVFNMASKRVDKEAKNAQSTSGNDEYKLKKIRRKKKANWKAKSAMLRDAISASKGYNSGMQLYDTPQPMPSIYDDRVECPHCNRRFAEHTAERHIPKCRDIIAKPKRLRRQLR